MQIRVKDDQGELFLARDVPGGLVAWEKGYEAAW